MNRVESIRQISFSASTPRVTKYQLIYFIIWPFAALIHSLKDFRNPSSKTIFWLFCIYFGFAMVIPENIPGAADSARYAAGLAMLHESPLSFTEMLNMLYSPETDQIDAYEPILTWLMSSVTGNTHILFAVFASVFGYFYAQNLWMIFNHIHVQIKFLLFIFVLGFAVVNPIWNINGVRMWTAAQIFIYGALRYFLYDDKKGIVWAISSILVHFSFLFPVALLLIYLFLPINLPIFFVFFWLASFVNEIDMQTIRKVLSFLPEIYIDKINAYANETYLATLQSVASTRSWHVVFAGLSIRWVKYIWIIFTFMMFKKYKIGEQNPLLKKLFAFALFLGGWAQIAAFVPSGGRFTNISNSLFFTVFILLMAHPFFFNRVKWLQIVTAPLLIFFILFTIRMGMIFIGVDTILGNFPLAVLSEDQTGLIDFIKSFF